MFTAFGIITFVVVIVTAVVIDDRLMDWYLRRGRNEVGSTVRWVLGTHVALLACWIPVALVAASISDASDDRAWAGTVVVPMILVHGPVAGCFLPSRISGYRHSRAVFVSRGASKEVSRAMYWTGCPFAMIGAVACIAGFFGCFAP
jgi:hypothetical protein